MTCKHINHQDLIGGFSLDYETISWCCDCGARRTGSSDWVLPRRCLVTQGPPPSVLAVHSDAITDLSREVQRHAELIDTRTVRLDGCIGALSDRQEGGELALNERIDKMEARLDMLRGRLEGDTPEPKSKLMWKRIDALAEAFESQETALIDYLEFMSALEAISDKRRRRQSGNRDS